MSRTHGPEFIDTTVRHTSARLVPFPLHRLFDLPYCCIAVVLVVAICLAACSSTKTSDRDIALVSPDEALQLMTSPQGGVRLGRAARAVWVDSRPAAEYGSERIANAIHLPLDRARDEHHVLGDYDIILVYGGDYNSPRATALSKLLLELGYADVRTLRGGLRAWKAAGHPVVEGLE